MARSSSDIPRPNAQDKAERTTLAAASIMSEERKASDAKVAKLKALRMAQGSEAPVEVKSGQQARPLPAAKQPRAASIRKLVLQPDATVRKRKPAG